MWKTLLCQKPQKSEKWVDIIPNHKPHRKNDRFRVVSYNILARWKASSPMYSYSPPDCILWDNRSKAILDNIKSFEADFICLQEVDEYISFFDRNMEAHGYTGIYFPRGEGYKRDGCAIFFKPKFAELITYNIVDYNNLAERRCVASTIRGDAVSKLKCDCIGILAAFKILKPFNHVVIIATTHLKSGKLDEWDDVKLAQAKSLMFELAMFKRTISAVENCSPSVILAGDFNSNPSSDVYEYVNSDNIPVMWPLGDEEEENEFGLCSAYGFTKGEPKFTKYVPGFAETLDYVFFMPSDFISPVKLLDSPDVVDFLPNKSHPSDHLPIGVEFEINRNILL